MSNNIKTSELGTTFLDYELRNQCKAIYGSMALPGRKQGFAVIAAMDLEKHFDSHDIYLLDEFESFDLRVLIHKCGIFEYKYSPKVWFGDSLNDSADKFINEMNDAKGKEVLEKNPRAKVRNFGLVTTTMLEMDNLYSYILPELKRLMDPERRMLYLKHSKIVNYLSDIDPAEIAELRLGDYPAIEALAFAVLEMRMHYSHEHEGQESRDESNLANTYNMETVF